MCFANGRCLLCIAFLVLFAALLILAVVHRVRAKKKVLALTPGERVRLLNELAEPFGFAYLPAEDIFTSRLDAWQRDKGYEAKYDTMAVGAGMVIDAFPCTLIMREEPGWMILEGTVRDQHRRRGRNLPCEGRDSAARLSHGAF